MTQNTALTILALAFTVLEAPSLVHGQQPGSQPARTSINTTSLPEIYKDEEGLDLLNPPIPCKYAHGFKRVEGNGIRSRMPSPPSDKQARELYLKAQSLQEVGFAYLMYKRPEKAIIRFKQSLALWPDSARTYRWLAEAYEANGQTQEAITNYRLLFYGWPGKYIPNPLDDGTQPKTTPVDKPSDYDQPNPEEADPTLLMRFSLLLQQTNQYTEAQSVYNRGVQALAQKFPGKEALAPLASTALMTPSALEAATRTALAADELSYQDKPEAIENLKHALRLQPDFALADNYLKQNAK